MAIKIIPESAEKEVSVELTFKLSEFSAFSSGKGKFFESLKDPQEIVSCASRKETKMQTNTQWRPKEIIICKEVKDDPATIYFLNQCPGIPLKYVNSAKPTMVVQASDV